LNVPGTSGDQKDPLLTRWQYGLGRTAVFASDAKARWAEAWVAWPGFDRFWANVLRDLLPHADSGEVRADFDPATSELVIDYRLGRHVPEPAQPPALFVFGPDGFQAPVQVQKTAVGVYRGKVRIGDRSGLFRVRPLTETRAFPETGYYREEREMTQFGADEGLLRQVAQFTGGRFNPDPRSVFNSGGRSVASSMRLWPALLAFAIALNVLELILRKWAGLRFRKTA
jgi:Ca-activated chloride channel family protein